MRVLVNDELSINYELTGDPSTQRVLILTHGMGGSLHNWDDDIAELSKRYAVLAWDVRGHGESDKPDVPYTPEMHARDLAGLEPFAAYILRSAGLATLTVAAVGLVASFFVPQAYCRFGCPTGALLNFVRARGAADRFSRRDAVALFLVGLAALLNWKYLAVILWIKGPS